MQNLKAPFTIGFQITGLCTLSCRYCYASQITRNHLSFNDALYISKQLIESGIFSIGIEGGEPLMHPNWYEITRFFVDAGIDVTLITNGTIYDKIIQSKFQELLKSEPTFTLQVSLDSHIPEINNKSRGKGAEVLNNIAKMIDANLDIAIASVVNKYNMNSLFDLVEVFYPSVKKFHFMNLMETAESNNNDLFAKKDELKIFWQKVPKLEDSFPEISLSTPLTNLNTELGNGILECQGCTAGLTRATIAPDLNVLPCGICDNSWVMGNMKNESLEKIWQNPKSKYIRELNTPLCKIKRNNLS